MELEVAANVFKELGHPVRLTIFKLLVKAGHNGLPVGEIQEQLSIPDSTLSHHISKLVSVELIRQHREGTTLHCIPQYALLNSLIVYLNEECCMGQGC